MLQEAAFRLIWNAGKWYRGYCIKRLKRLRNIHDSVELFFPITWVGNIQVGEGSYFMPNCEIVTGNNSTVTIGRNCAVARNVTIRALTHEQNKPFRRLTNLREADIVIGDDCWIGSNVFIKEGVTLGNHVIVGANCMVTQSFPDNSLIAGVPAKLIHRLSTEVVESEPSNPPGAQDE